VILKKTIIKRTSKKAEKMNIRIFDGYAWVYEGYYLFGFIPLYVVRTHAKYNGD